MRPWPCSQAGQYRALRPCKAFLQSGNYYVPIDEQMPEARMRRILTQVHARAIVFFGIELPAGGAAWRTARRSFAWRKRRNRAGRCALQARREQIIDLDPVYLLFTSGSTGTPKGIVISPPRHSGLYRLADGLLRLRVEHEVFGNQSPFYFDTSCKDLYQTLKLGATCVILEKKFFALPLFLLQALDQHGVTAVNWATSAFHLAASSGARNGASRMRCGRSSSAASAAGAVCEHVEARDPGGRPL